jgi:hypothetical protein
MVEGQKKVIDMLEDEERTEEDCVGDAICPICDTILATLTDDLDGTDEWFSTLFD